MALSASEIATIDNAIRRDQALTSNQFRDSGDYTTALGLLRLGKQDKRQSMANVYSPIPPAIQELMGQKIEENNRLTGGPNALTRSVVPEGSSIHDQNQLGIRNYVQDFLKNGNPNLQRGISEIQLPGERQAFQAPNALLQLMSGEQGYNQDRVNVIDKYFGRAGTGQYSSRAVVGDFLKQLSGSPDFQGSGGFNPLQVAQARERQMSQQRETLMASNGGVMTERRDVGGKIIGGNNVESPSADLSMNPNAAASQAADRARRISDALRRLEQMKATTSNLPITERVIR